MRRVWALACCLALGSAVASTPALSANALKGCFQQNFDKAYLKKVEKQFITAIQLDIKKGNATTRKPNIEGKLRAKFRDDKETWWQGTFLCLDGGPSWSCSMECEGGTFILSPGKKGLQLVNQSFLRFHKTDCETEPRDIRADLEHTTFIMPQLTSGACKK
jgi:hypothetical protein